MKKVTLELYDYDELSDELQAHACKSMKYSGYSSSESESEELAEYYWFDIDGNVIGQKSNI